MKRLFYILPLIVIFVASSSAQKISKPKKMPAPVTESQQTSINQGVALHDAKKYDEAIAKYLAVLNENPDSTLAIYELALSYAEKGDRAKAKETALKGSAYISDELPLFYGLIANALDDEGKSEDAIKLYRDAENILESFSDMRRHLSSIYYNLGLTYFRLKKYPEARAELKKAVESNFSYASPHYLLSVVFNGTKYQVPAFLAAARLISLETNTQRTRNSVDLISSVLQPTSKDPKTGNITINLDFFAPKDEGDFAMFDLLLPTLTTMSDKEDAKKSDNQKFIAAIDTVIAMLGEEKKLQTTFVGKTYVPFMVEMKKAGHVETFGNMILYIKNNGNAEAAKWLTDNNTKLTAFLAWGKAYKMPSK